MRHARQRVLRVSFLWRVWSWPREECDLNAQHAIQAPERPQNLVVFDGLCDIVEGFCADVSAEGLSSHNSSYCAADSGATPAEES